MTSTPASMDSARTSPITIDAYFDFVCPWCYIGRHRLRRALEARPEAPVSVRWQPYQLNPGMPQAGIDRRSYLIAKFGGAERVSHVLRLIRMAAENDGLPIALESIPRTPNSLGAHRLTALLTQRGFTPEIVIDRLFTAFMVEGRDIGDIGVLAEIAETLGEDRDVIVELLSDGSDIDAVQARDLTARRTGIQAVPCFIFNQRYALSGAQEPTAFFPFIDHPEIYQSDYDGQETSGTDELRFAMVKNIK
jgi:predicted DsbA family dithiol-disulfide isomerase